MSKIIILRENQLDVIINLLKVRGEPGMYIVDIYAHIHTHTYIYTLITAILPTLPTTSIALTPIKLLPNPNPRTLPLRFVKPYV